MLAWIVACESGEEDLGKSEPAEVPEPTLAAATAFAGEPVRCADPAARAAMGAYEELDGGVEWRNQPITDTLDGWGVAAADFDGDGYLDLYLPRDGADHLYMGAADGVYREESGLRLPDREDALGLSAVPADYDGDGDLDVWVGNLGANALYRNDDGVLRSVGEAAGIASHAWASEDGAWGDMDGDGDLDLVVANMSNPGAHEDPTEADPNELYENLGDGTFADVGGRLAGMATAAYTHAVGWFDLDRDVDLDLMIVNDKPDLGYTTVVRLQEAGALVDDEGRLGLEVPIEGMGVGAGDLNGDRLPDLLISGWGELALMESAAEGTRYDTALARGFAVDAAGSSVVAWGVELADVDNDGDQDAWVAFGQELELDGTVPAAGEANPPDQRDRLWLAEAGAYTDASAAMGVDAPGLHRGFVLADLDRDGWLDLVERDLGARARILRARCGEASWVGVRLVGPPPNVYAVGARIEVEAAGLAQVRWIDAGGTNIASGGPPEAHFGLGDAEEIEVRVVWPDGAVSELSDLPARRWITLTREDAAR